MRTHTHKLVDRTESAKSDWIGWICLVGLDCIANRNGYEDFICSYVVYVYKMINDTVPLLVTEI